MGRFLRILRLFMAMLCSAGCFMNPKIETVDVRDDIRSGREPFSKIMSAAARLPADHELLIIAPFEPRPLFSVMKKQGFSYASKPTPAGDWEVLFRRQTEPAAVIAKPAQSRDTGLPITQVVEVDARGLEPPQPMVKILETLADLPQDTGLDARTDRRPMHLYAQLEERGFTAESEEQSDGSYLTHIRRC
jgi:uncharacterized protein (DUF2249 family)